MTTARDRWLQPTSLGAGVLLLAALVGMANYLGHKYYLRFDWTPNDLYSLSEKSEGLMATLDRDIEAVVFMGPEAPLFEPMMELLSQYDASSPRFSVRVVDPVKNLLEAQALVDEFGLAQVDVIVFVSANGRRIVESADLADYDYSGLQFGHGPELLGFKGEQVFSGSILELVEDRRSKILFTVGHGELSLDEFSGRGLSEARNLLTQDNFELEEWASLGAARVPADASLVVIAGPTSNFIEPELAVLRAFLEEGGRLLAFVDPVLGESGSVVATGLEDLLSEYGVEMGDDVVVDPANPIPFYGPETIFVDDYGAHAITESLSQARVPVILPLARSVSAASEPPQDLTITELLRSSADGWGERSLNDLGRVQRDDRDLAGPVSLAVSVSSQSGSETSPIPDIDSATAPDVAPGSSLRLIALGDSDLVTNSQLLNVGNTELLLSSVNWLLERENLIGIPSKDPRQLRLSLTEADLRVAALVVFGLLPGLALAVGGLVFFKRRR